MDLLSCKECKNVGFVSRRRKTNNFSHIKNIDAGDISSTIIPAFPFSSISSCSGEMKKFDDVCIEMSLELRTCELEICHQHSKTNILTQIFKWILLDFSSISLLLLPPFELPILEKNIYFFFDFNFFFIFNSIFVCYVVVFGITCDFKNPLV